MMPPEATFMVFEYKHCQPDASRGDENLVQQALPGRKKGLSRDCGDD